MPISNFFQFHQYRYMFKSIDILFHQLPQLSYILDTSIEIVSSVGTDEMFLNIVSPE